MVSSIIIIGASGSFGSKIALKLTELYPKQYHLLLAARSTDNDSVQELSTLLHQAGADFSWENLDLSSLDAVTAFTNRIRASLAEKEIPPLYGIVNSAAIQMLPVTCTVDGFDLEYQTNTLAPVLLMQKLVPLMDSGVVINVSSSTHALGDYGQFKQEHTKLQDSIGNVLSTLTLLNKYGSTKLILMMAGYALRRDERFVSSKSRF
jgi:NAD(P)-dependent dehydrogenase (short-subunit alcohol dehydrogenase family)